MMIKNKLGSILLLIFVFAVSAQANAGPPKGYVKVDVNWVIETKEDLSDYRFFVSYFGDLAEVKIINPGKTIIPPVGGGVRYNGGQLIAISKKNLDKIGENLTNEQLLDLWKLIDDGKLDGAIKLSNHTFYATVLETNKGKVVTPTYVIERKKNTLVMFKKKQKIRKVSFEGEEPAQKDANTLIGGIFLSFSFVFGGVFLFRKRS